MALTRRDGPAEPCIVNCDKLVAVHQDDLVEHVTTLVPERMAEVQHAVLFALGYD